jgi:peptidoglycan hydrolase CwlO-like protein
MLIKKSQKELQTQIQTLSNELSACKNIEKQHKRMNGKLYEEVDKLKKELEQVKKENAIFKENLQAELLRQRIKK